MIDPPLARLHTLDFLVEAGGVVVAALSGIADARRKQFDLVGVYAVAFLTAFGGGTLRDLLLDRRPLFWVANPWYALLILLLALGYLYVPAVSRAVRGGRARIIATVFDAFALGSFGAIGAWYAIEQQVPAGIAVIFGVVSGAFGGVLRDIVINEVPMIFTPRTFYAVPVLLGSTAFVVAERLGMPHAGAIWLGTAVTIVLRLAGIQFRLRLPAPVAGLTEELPVPDDRPPPPGRGRDTDAKGS
jgi:uncharacterized membrane protein YeiH